ncbi:MAG TPA: glycosyl hydrolase family 18 protein [Gemmatimonadaceae bacterium]|jgi:spore germination protein YaaH
MTVLTNPSPTRVAAFGLGLLLGLTSIAPAQVPTEALWYSTADSLSTASFIEHAAQISIVSPQVFALNAQGVVHGKVDPRVVAAAKAHHVKLVPLVMNPGFDQALIHKVITTPAIAAKAASNIAALCRDNHFDGIQFDIENVHVKDRDALTAFMRNTAIELHKVGCTASAAVVPRLSDDPGPTSYHRWIYDNWRAVYDYKALAESLDFLSYMTYAQHTGGSTPGPVAGYTWVEACLKFVLSTGVPPSKISLGIASYSDHWYPSWSKKDGPRQRGGDISYARAESLLARANVKPTWDDRDKALWATWSNAGIYEHLWIEDARAFAAKVDLVRQYKLRGYSVWVLGTEDSRVWDPPSRRYSGPRRQ